MKEEFQIALQHRERGEYKEALCVLRSLESQLSHSVKYLAVLADTYWELGQYGEAVATFRQALKIAPDSEMVSLGLFHCLLKSGDIDAAFDEMRRFLSIADSEEYRRLLLEINTAKID